MRTVITGIIAVLVLAGCQTVPIKDIKLTQSTYGIEAEDWGVPQTRNLRTSDYHDATPTTHPAATLITTRDLHARLIGPNPPLLLDVLGGDSHSTLPGAIWLRGAGSARYNKLGSLHMKITGGDLSRPVVVFCLSAECWLSYNAALRLKKIGYKNVFWYRGGTEAWKQAGLPTMTAVQYTRK